MLKIISLMAIVGSLFGLVLWLSGRRLMNTAAVQPATKTAGVTMTEGEPATQFISREEMFQAADHDGAPAPTPATEYLDRDAILGQARVAPAPPDPEDAAPTTVFSRDTLAQEPMTEILSRGKFADHDRNAR